ncbi:hypothetical protein BJY04DRAFT_5845 [Aspergillus karnatakaensis]|uniref:uncharacterized protein n=1 Tax=Aspergillus karnatakaensis TaxID=1810916 RepID=UPI003CCE01C0
MPFGVPGLLDLYDRSPSESRLSPNHAKCCCRRIGLLGPSPGRMHELLIQESLKSILPLTEIMLRNDTMYSVDCEAIDTGGAFCSFKRPPRLRSEWQLQIEFIKTGLQRPCIRKIYLRTVYTVGSNSYEVKIFQGGGVIHVPKSRFYILAYTLKLLVIAN